MENLEDINHITNMETMLISKHQPVKNQEKFMVQVLNQLVKNQEQQIQDLPKKQELMVEMESRTLTILIIV
jgi:hypothetical protein